MKDILDELGEKSDIANILFATNPKKDKTFPLNDLVQMKTNVEHTPTEYQQLDEYNGLLQGMGPKKRADPCARVPLSSPIFKLLCKRLSMSDSEEDWSVL